RPGQQIYIPLRRLRGNPVPGRKSGIVTIPFVDLSRGTGRTPPPAKTYRVKRGNTVSQLIAGQFGRFGSQSYKDAVALFKQLNPHVNDIDLIFSGQTIFLPRESQLPQDLASRENLKKSRVSAYPQSPPPPGKKSSGTSSRRTAKPMIPPLAEAAAIMDAKLLDSGKFYFPRSNSDDLELDLTRTPVLEMSNGRRVMLSGKQALSPPDLETVKAKWKTFTQVNIPSSAPVEAILNTVLAAVNTNTQTPSLSFSAGGARITIRAKWIIKGAGTEKDPVRNICISFIEHPDQRTPTGVVRFFKHHGIRLKEVFRGSKGSSYVSPLRAIPVPRQNPVKTVLASGRRSFVSDLLKAMDYAYTQNVTITFPYAGTEIKALSNLVNTPEGNPVFVDYGDLFGDAFLTIQKSGFNIIQINHTDTPGRITAKLAGALGPEWFRNPAFLAAQRPAQFNTEFVIKGYLTEKRADTAQMLLTFTSIDRALVNMLNERNIRIIVLPGDAR
ncbi:MAG: LysM peptidoglycan-binding domain-containing protein, partial [Desulfobacterales bacterium]|nr:LysM peptidoglycan-binding domain-containing protein [Desulfobacterales bacterium]